jgi:curved DNA-binding protein CbpA
MAVEYDPRADCYVTLGIEDSATDEDIKKAHRARIRALHPDRGGDAARATSVNLARDVLGDPSSRRTYDKARRAWFMELLKDPTMGALFDRDGRRAAHLASQQRAAESADASAANAQQGATTTTFPSEAERAARHARTWQWGVMADVAWPDVRKALRDGDWLAAITWLGTALFVDRAIEIASPAEQLAALDALIGPRQTQRKLMFMDTIARALGNELGRAAEELAAQARRLARHDSAPAAGRRTVRTGSR